MTPKASTPDTPSSRRRAFRPKLREATLILPNGSRVKRNITFGPTIGLENAIGDMPSEHSPLLEGRVSQEGRSGRAIYLRNKAQRWVQDFWAFTNSRTGRGILKCSIAYLLGSLATFVPQIAAILGQQDGKHMVATITVYFHPARSMGSMFEAIICAIVAFTYAVFICFSSMGASIFFGQTLDMIVLGHILVLMIFCGGGLGFVGWIKQRLGHPLVNISCSLTSLAIITVLTKEGAVQAAEFSDEKITQVMIMIGMGVCATTAVSFLISPVSARTDLKDDLAHVTDSFADLLTMTTRSFLTGQEEELQQEAFGDAMKKYKKLFTSLTKNLKEARNEHYVLGTEREYSMYAQLVNCMQRLGQNIGGLRSAATTEFWLLAQSQSVDSDVNKKGLALQRQRDRDAYFPHTSNESLSPIESHGVLESIDETRENVRSDDAPGDLTQVPMEEQNLPPLIMEPTDIFSRFIVQLGPSMKSLSITLKKILDELPYTADGQIAVNTDFKSSLADAVKLYTASRQEALQLLYKDKELTKSKPMEMQADFEEVAASCGYFSFSLLDFACEMQVYLDILDDLKLEIDERPKGRTWNWLKFWRRLHKSEQRHSDPEQDSLIDQNEQNQIPGAVPDPATRAALVSHPKNQNITQTFRYKLWLALSFFRRDDVKFAVKVGIGAALYALPSFLASTRPFYQHWRGEWGLLSYMLVCAMTLGASNTTGYARFLGTCIGALCAIVAWTVSDGNPYLLAFFGWIMSLWTAYIIVAQGKGPMGRFIMLTYNLSALYAYSLSVKEVDGDEDEGGIDPVIAEIALHRVVAVLSGCLWGLVITRLIWPISARQKFKEGLSILWLRMSLVWARDPLRTLLPPPPPPSSSSTTNQPTASPPSYMDLREEFSLHRYLTVLENLSSAASSEVNLRGPFPSATYSRILKSTGEMLDAFHAMNVMILKNSRTSEGERKILEYTSKERGYLCKRISHQFQVLASSMKLQYPLNEALPSAENARERLLTRIFKFRRMQEGRGDGDVGGNDEGDGEREDEEEVGKVATDEDFELLYCYALVTGMLSREIEGLGRELEGLFGVLNEESLKLQ